MNENEIINDKILPDAERRIQFIAAIKFSVKGQTLTNDDNTKRFRTQSGNLAERMIPSVFKDLRIHIDGDYLWPKEESGVVREGGWHVKAEYKWTHFGSGTNGCEIAVLWYDEEGNFQDMRTEFATQ